MLERQCDSLARSVGLTKRDFGGCGMRLIGTELAQLVDED